MLLAPTHERLGHVHPSTPAILIRRFRPICATIAQTLVAYWLTRDSVVLLAVTAGPRDAVNGQFQLLDVSEHLGRPSIGSALWRLAARSSLD